ncbi:DUF1156 domain-containing protein [Methanocorpusculum sp. GPch4]|uniref:DUF1156 domain-containing protein n=1 Tax=Methanocorpusculum sp. GPch4 TaxID=2527877 RepID=UPI0014328344|nr:DUF1156 domain-containing protein [Methanocorpusculum sp. GPch4]
MTEIIKPKKLIETSIPLDAINIESAREKSIRHGHPSTLHLWWARRPLAAARAVLFCQMVNDPGWNNPNPTPQQIGMYANQRKKLFRIIREMVKWENSDNERILKEARNEIWKSWVETCEANKDHPEASTLFDPDVLPAGHDPFAGGGAIPLEMQRLGLTAYASDLNPVAVMINKAMIEIPPKCAGHAPINPGSKKISSSWKGCTGLAEDIKYYGNWMREEAFKRIGHLYPKVKITEEMTKDRPDLLPYVGQELTVIAWVWARTVKSPNPAFANIDVPLVNSFTISVKQKTWVEPVIRDGNSGYDFVVRTQGEPTLKEGTVGRKGGVCIMSGSSMDLPYIRSEAQAGRMGERLMAVVCEGSKGRIYLSPDAENGVLLPENFDVWKSTLELPKKHRDFKPPIYGMVSFGDIFSRRQLVALSTFSDLIPEVIHKISTDSKGTVDKEYALGLATYLAFVLDKCADYWSSVCTWISTGETIRNTFGRQAIAMSWGYAETNPFSDSTGNWMAMVDWVWKVVERLPGNESGYACQADAQKQTISQNKIISMDPPYYDVVMFGDISDFFYVWMRRSLRSLYPNLFETIATPKEEEIIASSHRFGSKENASKEFMNMMSKALTNIANLSHPAFPVTIYYAFKQAETKEEGTVSTGWETFLDAVMRSGFAITGTWPMRTERGSRMNAQDSNSLASAIILVCRKREANAPKITRKEFIKELNIRLPQDLNLMTGVEFDDKIDFKVSAVDLAQAAIGPGMAIYSKYSGILEANGSTMSVHDALLLINKVLSAYLDKDDNELDADTKFCKSWFEQNGWNEGKYGEAEVLATAKGTSISGLQEAGVLQSGRGNVRLLRFTEYPDNWDPETDSRLPVWEALHHLVKAHQEGGDAKAGRLFSQIERMSQSINLLATRLYQICEQKGWAEDARYYNELTASWQNIEERPGGDAKIAREPSKKKEVGQKTLEGFSIPLTLPFTLGTLKKPDEK